MTDLTPDQIPDGWSRGAAGYEEAFAPFTAVYAEEALALSGVGPGHHVLDVAAGSGALSLRAARLGAEVLATDFAQGMVDLVATRLAEEGHDSCSAAVMDGQNLEIDEGSFDHAFSMFGVIFFPDIDAGIRELARAVRPGGTICIATWRLEGFRLLELVGTAFTRAIPGFEPPASEPSWARIGDTEGVVSAFESAGLVEIEVHTVTRSWQWDDSADFFRRLPTWSPPVQPLFEMLDDETIERAAIEFAGVVEEATGHDAGVETDALIGIGRKP
jgi:SAM-dependent methyltransferase